MSEKTFTANQKVTVATATGKRDAVIVDGHISKQRGNVRVQMVYPNGDLGQPRGFHIDDVEPRS